MMKSIVSMIAVLAATFLLSSPVQAGYADGMNQYAAYHVIHGAVDPMGLSASDPTANAPSPIPARIKKSTLVVAQAGQFSDRLGNSLNKYLEIAIKEKVFGSNPEYWAYYFGPDTSVSKRVWENKDALEPFRESYENAVLFCDCDDKNDTSKYDSGWVTYDTDTPDGVEGVKTATLDLFGEFTGMHRNRKELGHADASVDTLGGVLVVARQKIDCAKNTVEVEAWVYNEWNFVSASTNPATGKPMMSGNSVVQKYIHYKEEKEACCPDNKEDE